MAALRHLNHPHCVAMTRMEYDTKNTAPLEKDDAMILSGLFAVSEKVLPVKIPSRLVNRAVPTQKAMTVCANSNNVPSQYPCLRNCWQKITFAVHINLPTFIMTHFQYRHQVA